MIQTNINGKLEVNNIGQQSNDGDTITQIGGDWQHVFTTVGSTSFTKN